MARMLGESQGISGLISHHGHPAFCQESERNPLGWKCWDRRGGLFSGHTKDPDTLGPSISTGRVKAAVDGAGFEPRHPGCMAWVFTPSYAARERILRLEGKTWNLTGSGCLQTSTSVGFHPRGPSQTGDRSSCFVQSMERARSRWARSAALIQCCPSNPGQRPHKQDRPRRRQAGGPPLA